MLIYFLLTGLKLAHSNGSIAKPSELTCLQRRAVELTGVPLINFNIKRSASVRGDIPMDNIDNPVKPEPQVKTNKIEPFQFMNSVEVFQQLMVYPIPKNVFFGVLEFFIFNAHSIQYMAL
jgi:hypothetical protein